MSERTGALTSYGIALPRQNRGWRHMTGRQRVGIVIRACLQTAVQIAAARDLLRRPSDEVRGGRKWLWALAIAANYLGIGPIVYLIGGRRPHGG